MALNLATQVGPLCGTPVVVDTGSVARVDQQSGPMAAWKQQPAGEQNLRCRIQKSAEQEEIDVTLPMSPGRPPLLMGAQPDLLVADKEAVKLEEAAVVMEHLGGGGGSVKGVPVFVMMPLDTVKPGGRLNRRKAINASLMALKNAGVEGVMIDVWWGLVEKDRPGEYDWRGYDELLDTARRIGLKVQAVMSFHQCGGNVGDTVMISLPQWVLEEMDKDPDLAYTDQWGCRNYEYVSLGCDMVPVLKDRTPIQCYADFMRAFRDHFAPLLGTTIVVRDSSGNGSCRRAEVPFLSRIERNLEVPRNRLKAAAEKAGKMEWGNGGPTDAGAYNDWPEDTSFFRHDGGWNGPYGEFFLSWYSQMLLDHGERILSSATSVFDSAQVKISVKVAGIHWHYGTSSHASELTAGYYNTRYRDGYLPIARMLGRHGAVFNFTCVEMRDGEQPGEAACKPEELVRQVAAAARDARVELAGENALSRYDEAALEQILNTAARGAEEKMAAFTYLRMGPDLFQPDNWRRFVAFVKNMTEGRGEQCRELLEREADRSVYATVPKVQSSN
ncbi:hypothetical protein ZIOFF_044160 [Zingiber officinale]|uniref:Beta-amylase n=1 Tax=Zingiber officinale TaxID=94328 RepID=A0A8J5KUB5_ZINOF|nr:hypothetical protein ZIOFF_044160 [Zingiber officinale]